MEIMIGRKTIAWYIVRELLTEGGCADYSMAAQLSTSREFT
jgi:hypothetical protein